MELTTIIKTIKYLVVTGCDYLRRFTASFRFFPVQPNQKFCFHCHQCPQQRFTRQCFLYTLPLLHISQQFHVFLSVPRKMVAVKEGISDTKAAIQIPEGRPKSGRTWKLKQTSRFSFQQRQGVVSHLNKSFEEKELIRAKKDRMLALEREMKEDNKRKAIEEKQRREDQQKRRMENEYKNSVYQTLRPEKLKGMSKKQLRMVRKTAMNKNGQLELVNPWNISDRKKQGR